MIIKNAFLSIKKSLGKTILLFVIMALIANLVIAGLSIKNATTKSMDQVRTSLGSDVTLSYNMQYLMSKRTKGQAMDKVVSSIKLSDAKKLAGLKYVSSYNYTQTVSVDSDDIDPVKTSTSSSSSSSTSNAQMPGGSSSSSNKTMDSNNFTVTGNTTMAKLSDFTQSNYVLYKGRLLTSADSGTKNCVIEKNLASDNDLSVGDTFTVTSTDSDGDETTVKLKVVGIYKIKTSSSATNMSNRQSPYNNIYTSLGTAQKLNGSTTTVSSATYYIDDPDHIEAFEKLAKKTSINWKKFTLDANDQTYEATVSSLENMAKFSTIFLWVVIIAGSTILALILILTLRSRFYEFGVLLSLGQAKSKIVLQQLVEVGIIACLAFMLSLGTGKMVSNVVSNMLVSSQTTSSTSSTSSSSSSKSSSSSSTNSAPGGMMQQAMTTPTNTKLDVSLTGQTIGELAGITACICFVSVLLPSIFVLRLSPREILIKKEG